MYWIVGLLASGETNFPVDAAGFFRAHVHFENILVQHFPLGWTVRSADGFSGEFFGNQYAQAVVGVLDGTERTFQRVRTRVPLNIREFRRTHENVPIQREDHGASFQSAQTNEAHAGWWDGDLQPLLGRSIVGVCPKIIDSVKRARLKPQGDKRYGDVLGACGAPVE